MNNGILASGYAPPQMPGGLLGNPAAVEMADPYGYDPDARRYIRDVEAADGQRLELAVRVAFNDFVLGCKADGIWSAIKASCILMGARTLSGTLTPLAGLAPTNVNFVGGDYNRKAGLAGNASTKYLNANRNNNADPQNNFHNSVFITAAASTTGQLYMGAGGSGAGSNNILTASTVVGGLQNSVAARSQSNSQFGFAVSSYTGFVGHSRSAADGFLVRPVTNYSAFSNTSSTPSSDSVFVFARNNTAGTAQALTNGRLAFYSIGTSLPLATLEMRVTALYYAIGNAIP